MSREPQGAELASTTEASSAAAQSRGQNLPQQAPDAVHRRRRARATGAYEIGAAVTRAALASPYERRRIDPIYRPLKIYTSDPSASMLEGAIALVNVPYEPLEKGPRGRLFEIRDHNDSLDETYTHVDLDDPSLLIRNGRAPSPSDWLFHQQMVYAVCAQVYAAFRGALGRHVSWGFAPRARDDARLRIRPHAFYGSNAFYIKETGELHFGYYRAEKKVAGRNMPGSFVFTCLSHDVIAHEVTHALLDGLRAEFTHPANSDVLALHEAFADLVAIFQHFSYETVVLTALRKSRGDMRRADLLTDIARQFNYTITGNERPLRTAIDVNGEHGTPRPYCPDAPTHELGSVLVSAVFEAFVTIFARKTERYVRLATNGSGVLPPGEVSPDLQAVLAAKASKLASQFLTICIRAIDYCPPVAIKLGEFLRAMITADYDIVPDDRWGYREALIDAFRRREIYPDEVANLSEDALLWRPPESYIPTIPELGFARLRFRGDPGRPAGVNELTRQASALGEVMVRPEFNRLFGIAVNGDPALMKDSVARPIVQSIRSSRRIGPDGQIVFDLIAEITQRRIVRRSGVEFEFYGGSTVIIDPHGTIRYVISKRVTNDQRLDGEQQFMIGPGRCFWDISGGIAAAKPQLFRFLHA
ncbi:MAG: peptidase M4 [Acidobacteria bacterium]|nr:peptidase M4 [Acidobacteriota bacterium]MCA1627058.1 peptidase M4 [Acidobacteriota bacterium]